ncbi:hypothetical protein ACI2OX_14770 [Bacillus sp. N9]
MKKIREPLLYIVQPELTKPELTMQDVHLSNEEEDEAVEVVNEAIAAKEEVKEQAKFEEEQQNKERYEETVNDGAQPRWVGDYGK